ncbi:olfactory receptor 52M1-like [Heterocephalus glaber]|uniref:Olfactory receptor 52M1-like n=1 Tax=Heterocephalus glaber TaxID=10181 RepID=A0AAX6QM63_HETGA|nr:olfactory receptor 52M1-like [Heterocephalus glaber]
MEPANSSLASPTTFLLMGIPGLEHMHVWIGIPFCSMYLVAVVGNLTILAVVRAERSLHEPMFLFLCMLSLTDLVLSTSTLPRMLCLFWFGAHEIAFDACLAQMFFIHSFTAMESGFFLAMAIDRYVAICDPLHHATILTHSRLAKMGAAVLLRGVAFFSPHPILLKQLPYCRTHIIAHTYCEFMAVVKLACEDTRATKRYSLSVASVIGSSDGFFIALSYVLILRAKTPQTGVCTPVLSLHGQTEGEGRSQERDSSAEVTEGAAGPSESSDSSKGERPPGTRSGSERNGSQRLDGKLRTRLQTRAGPGTLSARPSLPASCAPQPRAWASAPNVAERGP